MAESALKPSIGKKKLEGISDKLIKPVQHLFIISAYWSILNLSPGDICSTPYPEKRDESTPENRDGVKVGWNEEICGTMVGEE